LEGVEGEKVSNVWVGCVIYMCVQRLLTLLTASALSFGSGVAVAAHTQAKLVLSAETARPGDSVMAGVRLQMDAGWHTYWKNSGSSGMASKIEWELPSGITAGETRWPLPEKLGPEDLTTYVYRGDVVLLVPLKLAGGLKPGSLELKAKVSWLECSRDLCVPAGTNVGAKLQIAFESKPSADGAVIEAWQSKLPKSEESPRANAFWEMGAIGASRPLILEWVVSGAPGEADFFPYEDSRFEIQPRTESLAAEAGKIRLRKTVKKLEGDWPKEISGVLIHKSNGRFEGFEVTLPVAAGETPQAIPRSQSPLPVAVVPAESLWKMLLYAFIGGFVLNIMPCVFPIIALKVLGFVRQGNEEPRRVFRLGLIYTLGVLVSFLALAAMVIIVRRAGGAASWGMQLQNPQSSVVLTVLVTLVALNLFGVFEVTPGGRVLGMAGQLASKHGAAGAFFNGVLATVLATPCTAPFLAPALGFAFTQPPPMIVVTFLAVGLGLAAPYIVLSWRPGWLRFLPKPGAWMEKFKMAMGFPMLATAVWLFWFTAPRFGEDGTLWLGLFLIIVALAAWIWGEFVQRGTKRRVLAAALSLVLLAAGYGYALEKELHWRSPVAEATNETGHSNQGIAWQPWSPEAVAAARAEGRPVLVDFTARWCLTCQLNKRDAIEVPEVRSKLREINATALIENSSEKDATVVAELNRYGRAGVPLVLVYPRDAAKPPIVLPAFLTKGIVLDALDRAAK
jgi:thiol:disulfide interchange protein